MILFCVIIYLINEFNEYYQRQSNPLRTFMQLILTFGQQNICNCSLSTVY